VNINLDSIDRTQFYVNEHVLNGEMVYLVIPQQMGCHWTQQNKIFRSSLWDHNGNLLSAGFPKFVNFSENPEVFPVPLTINNCFFVEKIDGSLTCIDYRNNQISMRTRGTISVDSLQNSADFYYCLSKYPKISQWLKENSHYTLLCEITTPNLRIILDYGNEPDFWLVGAINKNDYSLMTQLELNELKNVLGLRRPELFSFNSIEELLVKVSAWSDKEGVCLYSKNGQEIHKIKAVRYLFLHHMKSELNSLEKVLDVYFAVGKPSYQDFCKYLETTFDYELMRQCIPLISKICEATKEVNQIINGMNNFIITQLKPLNTRKLQAASIIHSYGKTNRSNFIFSLLDGKQLTNDQIKKLYFQVLK